MRCHAIQQAFWLILVCMWCCNAYQFLLPRHFFTRHFGQHLTLHDLSSPTAPLIFEMHLRYNPGQDRLIVINPLPTVKVLYKVMCQTKGTCHILGWTSDRTDVTILASVNTMAWYPFATENEQNDNETIDKMNSAILLKRPLIISTVLFDEAFTINFFPAQKQYTIAYGSHHVVAEVENFDRSTSQYEHDEDYSLKVFENINPEIDPAFLVSICIVIDYMEWPYYFL